MPPSLEGPQDAFKELQQQHLDGVASGVSWIALWERFATNAAFLSLLDRVVSRTTTNYGLPSQWEDDLKQESLLYFAGQLQKRPTLGFDPSKGSYTGWLYVILHGCVCKGIRQFNDSIRQVELVGTETPATGNTFIDIEVIEHVDAMDSTERELLVGYLSGDSVETLASRCRKSVRTVYRIVRRLMESLENAIRQN